MLRDTYGFCGKLLDGQIRVEILVGEGGFGVVYKGWHLGLNAPVAIKFLKLAAGMPESMAKRFRDESRISYRLSQGNLDIVRSITAGSAVAPLTGAVVPFMVLEWLEGRSLRDELLERRGRGLKGRSLDEVLALFDPAVNAVAYAHTQGIIHRDLKPANLFLAGAADRARLKVLDFGVAKIVSDETGIVPSVLTAGPQVLCSPAYGAPEQFDRNLGPMGPWTDVYSLGLLVLEALGDRKVRRGEGLAKCLAVALDPAQSPTCTALGIAVPPLVELTLARATALAMATRPPDAGAFWSQLKTAARSSSRSSLPSTLDDDAVTVFEPNPRTSDNEVTRAVAEPLAVADRGQLLRGQAGFDPTAGSASIEVPPPSRTAVMSGAPRRSAPSAAATLPLRGPDATRPEPTAATLPLGPGVLRGQFVPPATPSAPAPSPASAPPTTRRGAGAARRRSRALAVALLVVLLGMGLAAAAYALAMHRQHTRGAGAPHAPHLWFPVAQSTRTT